MSEIYQIPDNNGGNNNAGMGNIPFSIPIGGFGMGGGLFGGNYGVNGIADLFGLAIIASMFGWNNGGFGSMSSMDYLKAKLDESDFEVVKDENKAQ